MSRVQARTLAAPEWISDRHVLRKIWEKVSQYDRHGYMYQATQKMPGKAIPYGGKPYYTDKPQLEFSDVYPHDKLYKIWEQKVSWFDFDEFISLLQATWPSEADPVGKPIPSVGMTARCELEIILAFNAKIKIQDSLLEFVRDGIDLHGAR